MTSESNQRYTAALLRQTLELSATTIRRATPIIVFLATLGATVGVPVAISAEHNNPTRGSLLPVDPKFFVRHHAHGTGTSATDGVWTELPSLRRAFHTTVYDSGRRRMIVFGGENVLLLDDLWTFSLEGPPTWDRIITSGDAPPARALHSAIYDPVSDRMLVFGGTGEAIYGDVWALSLAGVPTWEELTPPGPGPGPRWAASAVYDAGGNQMLVFGGTDGSFFNDVWALSMSDPPAWSLLLVSASPPARAFHSATYDVMRDRVIVFGGTDGAPFNDVWALDVSEASWTDLTPPGTSPSGRLGSSAIYAPASDAVVIYGGTDGNNNLDDVWVLPLGAPAWTQLNSAAAPSRSFHSAIYEESEQMIVFGGADGPDEPRLADVWSLSLTGDSWTRLDTDNRPARALHSSIYDAGRDRMVIFGGKDNGGTPYRDDTWQLSLQDNAGSWQAIATVSPPPIPRGDHTAIYDPVRDQMVVFGGLSAFFLHRDVFTLSLADPQEWTEIVTTGDPPQRFRHAAIYDPVRDRMLVFGGDAWVSALNDVWSLTLTAPFIWQQLYPLGTPPLQGEAMEWPMIHRATKSLFSAGMTASN